MSDDEDNTDINDTDINELQEKLLKLRKLQKDYMFQHINESIEDNIKTMTTKEKCIEYYKCKEHYEDYADFILTDYEYDFLDYFDEDMDDTCQLKIIQYLIQHYDTRQEHNNEDWMNVCIHISGEDWGELLDIYEICKTREMYNLKYEDTIDEYIYYFEIEEELSIVSFNIAINKIKRSKIYNFGLGLKLNMISAGII